MAHEQVLEVVAGGGLADLLAAAVADPDDLAGGQHDLEGHDQVAGVTESGAQQREPATRDPAARRASRDTTPGCRGRSTPYCFSSSLSFIMLMPGPTVTVRSARSISWIWFIRLTSTRMPPRSGTAPSLRPVPPARGTSGIRARLASLTISDTCCAVLGRTTAAGMCSAQRCTGNGAGTRARFARLEMLVSTEPGSSMIASSSATTPASTVITDVMVMAPRSRSDAPRRPPTSIPADSATSSMMSATSMPASWPAVASGRSDQTQPLTSMSTSSSLARASSRVADLLGDLRLLDREATAPAGAVGPLRDMVDVLERQSGDRVQDEPGRFVDVLALVEPTGIVVGHDFVDRRRQLRADRP